VTHSLLETIQKIVRQELKQQRHADLAIVEERHPHTDDGDTDNYACSVKLRDTEIVLKQVPVATSRIGSAALPEVGDLVLVQYLRGDINAPVITGCFYNDEDRPPVSDEGQSVIHLPLGAEDADAVHIQMTSGDTREITITLGEGMSLTMKDDDPVVALDIADGKAQLSIARDGAVSLETKGDIDIKGGTVTVEAESELNLKGGTINLN
jgi:uncharacterized protein involved in type VI secretion and phage assembly